MRRILWTATLITVLAASSAQASWGPYNNCSQASHCYGLTYHYTTGIGSIAYEDTTAADVPGWEYGDFVSMEQWIELGNSGTWIETGNIIGSPGGDCCSVHEFSSAFRNYSLVYWHFDPAPIGANFYSHYALYDGFYRNGTWAVGWEGAGGACGQEWCWVDWLGGWPATFSNQEAGVEASATYWPFAQGRQEVANIGVYSGAWKPWTGAKWSHDSGVAIGKNYDHIAAGNLAWSISKGQAGGAAVKPSSPSDPLVRYTAGTGGNVSVASHGEYTTLTGSEPITPNLPHPRGRARPKGRVETLKMHNGFVERIWLGEASPTEAELREP